MTKGPGMGVPIGVDSYNIAYRGFSFGLDTAECAKAAASIAMDARVQKLVNGYLGGSPKRLFRRVFKGRAEHIAWRPDLRPNEKDGGYSNSDLHVDTFHAIVKGFFYVNDVSTDNGAFIYAPDSHRLTWKKLKLAYRDSVNEKFGALRVDHDQLRTLGFDTKPMCFPANTLIIADVGFGFHARGKFTSTDISRDGIYLDWRDQPFR